MTRFIPRPKLSKKARKELDAQKRTTWAFSPVTKKVESKKIYNRKKAAQELGISDRTLYRRLKQYGLDKQDKE